MHRIINNNNKCATFMAGTHNRNRMRTGWSSTDMAWPGWPRWPHLAGLAGLAHLAGHAGSWKIWLKFVFGFHTPFLPPAPAYAFGIPFRSPHFHFPKSFIFTSHLSLPHIFILYLVLFWFLFLWFVWFLVSDPPLSIFIFLFAFLRFVLCGEWRWWRDRVAAGEWEKETQKDSAHALKICLSLLWDHPNHGVSSLLEKGQAP